DPPAALDQCPAQAGDGGRKTSCQSHSRVAGITCRDGRGYFPVFQPASAMTYSNEYRLGRRIFPQHEEKSLAFVLAGAVVLALAGGFYVLGNRFHIRPAQLIEFSSYALYGLIGAISLTCYIATLRKRREANWPHPPAFISPERDRKAVRNACQ